MAVDSGDKKSQIAKLEAELAQKNAEVAIYRQEMVKISNKLDSLMSQISDDTKILSELQKVLMPTEIPTIPGFEISRKFVFGSKLGGDYFDIFEHEDKMKFGILLSSSSSYSMSALFMSMILKVSHTIKAKKGSPPEKIIQEIAEDLAQQSKPEDKSSVFYAVVDRRDFVLRFCSAGQILAYYQSPNKPMQILKSIHAPLTQANAGQSVEKMTAAKLELEAKGRLCVVSEGLSAVLSSDEIVKIMTDNVKKSVHDLRNELLFQASRKTKSEEPIRDQTVVVVEVKDRVIKLAK